MQASLSVWQVFLTYLRLGLTSFGGPVAHLSYFRAELVVRRKWLSEQQYADLVALAQFLPGPASSQVGFASGFVLAGWRGALAAWFAFTLPSVLVMMSFAGLLTTFSHLEEGWIAGLKICAVAVVAQAVIGMWGHLVAAEGIVGRIRTALALGTAAILLLLPGVAIQMLVLVICALIGLKFLPAGRVAQGHTPIQISKQVGFGLLALFVVLLLGLPLLAPLLPELALADVMYRAGALVFGGGHVVLPLLQAGMVPEFLSDNTFLAGYGVANAIPGPLFTFASYLGAAQSQVSALVGTVIATIMIFLPGMLLMLAALPFWNALAAQPSARQALNGLNAGVVGLLLAALYDPVITSAIYVPKDAALALVAYAALTAGKVPAWAVVLACAVIGYFAWMV